MSERGVNFLNQWITENIEPDAYPADGEPDPRVPGFLARCLADAKEHGITRKEIEEDMGPIADAIGEALVDATDRERDRLAARDD